MIRCVYICNYDKIFFTGGKMKTIMEYSYYNVTEISKMLVLSETTVRKLLRQGKISAKKIGKSWHVKESDVKTYLETGKTAV